MQKKILMTLVQSTLLLFLIIPEATTQESCEIDHDLRGVLEKSVDRWQKDATSGEERRKIYVSYLPILDGISKTSMKSQELALFDEAVKDLLQAGADSYPFIELNAEGHSVPQDDSLTLTFMEVAFDPNLTSRERFFEIRNRLLEPYGVDLLISGVGVDTGTVIQIKAIIASGPDEKIVAKDSSYPDRAELFTKVNGVLALTPKAREEIRRMAREVLSAL